MACKNMWIATVDQTPYGPIPRYVPCGKCEECLKAKRREWAYRCYAESKMSDITLFVTLTYADTDNIERYEYLQKYYKKLRKAGLKFRYFGCTEYGDTFGRLHHHILFFLTDDSKLSWPELKTKISDVLQKKWPYGHVMTLLSSEATINYTVGYIEKKLLEKEKRVHNFMSLRDPIGLDYAKKGLDFLRQNRYDVFNGQKYAVPRAFQKRLKLEKTKQELYNEQQERYKQDAELEQRTGKTNCQIDREQILVDKEIQRRNEARRRAQGHSVRKILRFSRQLPLPHPADVERTGQNQ